MPALGVTGVSLLDCVPGRGPPFVGPPDRLSMVYEVFDTRTPAVSFRVSVRLKFTSPNPAIWRS